jgi:hypothetical protein
MAPCKVAVILAGFLVTVTGRDFLGAKRKVNSEVVQAELQGVLAEVLGQGHGVADSRFNKIRQGIAPLFQTLPKNNRGHLSKDVMRYAVRRYFRQSHGWIVKGFEVHAESVTVNSSNTEMLQSELPAFIRTMMEKQFAHEGFSLDALIVMVAALERLAFDEVVRGVETSFSLNEYAMTDQNLTIHDLNEILSSFLIVEMLEGGDDVERHMVDKKYIVDRYPFWGTTLLFLMDTVMSDIWDRTSKSNPFQATGERGYSFEDAVRIGEKITERFGSWSNYECHEMKEMLMEMDSHETGRVKLADFYSYSKDGAWQFLEPSEQLRILGALDESSTWLGPQVMISNYITSMSNCITSASYYSICCLNECDHVYQNMESRIRSATASPSQIIAAMKSYSEAPNITTVMRERLQQVANVSGGVVHMHGRLFAQWLHFVFPRECPYPHLAGSVKPLTQPQWRELVGLEEESVTETEIQQHVESDYASRAPSTEAGSLMWNLQEALLESKTQSDIEAEKRSFGIFTLLRIAAQFGMLGSLLSMLRVLFVRLKPSIQVLGLKGNAKPAEYDV